MTRNGKIIAGIVTILAVDVTLRLNKLFKSYEVMVDECNKVNDMVFQMVVDHQFEEIVSNFDEI